MVLRRLKEIDGVFKKTVRLYDTRCPNADKKKEDTRDDGYEGNGLVLNNGRKLEAGTPGGI